MIMYIYVLGSWTGGHSFHRPEKTTTNFSSLVSPQYNTVIVVASHIPVYPPHDILPYVPLPTLMLLQACDDNIWYI